MTLHTCETAFYRANVSPNPVGMRDAKDADEWARTDLGRHQAIKRRRGGLIAKLVDRLPLNLLLDAGLTRLAPGALFQRLETAGAINGMSNVHQYGSGSPYADDACTPRSGGSVVHEGDPGCGPRQVCGEDAWPIRTRDLSNFPLVGNGTFVSAIADVRPTQKDLLPTQFWAAFYDSAIAAQPRIHGEVINVQIGNTTQFLGEGQGTQVYEDLNRGVAVQWDRIEASIGAKFNLGHPYAAAVEMNAYLTVWGFPNAIRPQ